MPQFSKKSGKSTEIKKGTKKNAPEYRGYVQIPLPAAITREELDAMPDKNVADYLNYYVSAGYRISLEIDAETNIKATAYGIATENGLDDGLGVSATAIDYHLAIRALLVKLNSAPDGLHPFYQPAKEKRTADFW